MASVKFHLSSSSKINSIDVSTGNLIFCEDTKTIYFDGADGRTEYRQIITLATEEIRQATAAIRGAFYFVKETLILWTYDEDWIQVTEQPDPQIIFDDTKDFPTIGDEERLYVCKDEIYRYYEGEYHPCSNDPEWETL